MYFLVVFIQELICAWYGFMHKSFRFLFEN